MESLIKDCIVQHLNDNNLILPSQHGFMAKKSCTTTVFNPAQKNWVPELRNWQFTKKFKNWQFFPLLHFTPYNVTPHPLLKFA